MSNESFRRIQISGWKLSSNTYVKLRVLGFDVDPYTDIDPTKLPFSPEDLQYLRYHFEVFSSVSLFGFRADETRHVARLDGYLDIRDARIMYQEQARITTQVPDPIPVPKEPMTCEQERRIPADVTEHCPLSWPDWHDRRGIYRRHGGKIKQLPNTSWWSLAGFPSYEPT